MSTSVSFVAFLQKVDEFTRGFCVIQKNIDTSFLVFCMKNSTVEFIVTVFKRLFSKLTKVMLFS